MLLGTGVAGQPGQGAVFEQVPVDVEVDPVQVPLLADGLGDLGDCITAIQAGDLLDIGDLAAEVLQAGGVVAVVEPILAVGRQRNGGRVVNLVVGPVVAERDIHSVQRQPEQGSLEALELVAAYVVLRHQGVVVGAVPVVVERRDPAPDAAIRHQRAAHDAGALDLVAVPNFHTDLGFGHIARPLGHIVDGAAERIAAVEGALGSLDHLDAFDVQLAEVETFPTGDVDAVDEYRGAVLAEDVSRHHAADDGHGQVLAEGIEERQARSQFRHIVQVGYAGRLDQRGVEGRDGQRHILQLLAHLPRRDHDLFHAPVHSGFGRLPMDAGARGQSHKQTRRQHGCQRRLAPGPDSIQPATKERQGSQQGDAPQIHATGPANVGLDLIQRPDADRDRRTHALAIPVGERQLTAVLANHIRVRRVDQGPRGIARRNCAAAVRGLLRNHKRVLGR